MADNNTATKLRLAALLRDLGQAAPQDVAGVLDRYCHAECHWEIFHPFGHCNGNQNAAARFWQPLRSAFPDYEFRPGLLLEGTYEERQHASMLGHLLGNLGAPWLGIPATHQLSLLRFAVNVVASGGKFAAVYVMFDLLDLMHQAGFYPLRRMPGSAAQWPFATLPLEYEGNASLEMPADGARTLAIIREMQRGLPKAGAVTDRASAAASHSPHWAEHMNWFGPAGIGSSRGMRGFRDYHGALFLQAFPDRSGIPRAAGDGFDRAGHFCEIGDGRLAMTVGWPAMRATHTGGQWLGLPPTGRAVEMRVADWYRLSPANRITDNWVMIDVPHILAQMGLDIVDDLRFFAEPDLPRL